MGSVPEIKVDWIRLKQCIAHAHLQNVCLCVYLLVNERTSFRLQPYGRFSRTHHPPPPRCSGLVRLTYVLVYKRLRSVVGQE